MPTFHLFKKFSSKSDAPKSPSATNVLPSVKRDVQQTMTPSDAVPAYPDSFKEAWAGAHKELPQAQGAEKFLNKIGGCPCSRQAYLPLNPHFHYRKEHVQKTLTLSSSQRAVVDTLATPVKALMDTPQIAETIKKGVNTCMGVIPPLVEALDAVAKIHPFIGGASPIL